MLSKKPDKMNLIIKSKRNYIINIVLNNNIVLRMRRKSYDEAEKLISVWTADPRHERLPLLARV